MNNCICSAEADILNKYKDIFPVEFVEAVRKGVSWLCTHNNITYQTSIMVASDRVLYNTAGTSVLRIGLINTDLPLTGLTYYEVKSIEVSKDEVSNNTVFTVKMKYTTPIGITVTLVPITYFNPEVEEEVYTKSEIDALIAKLQSSVDSKADAQVTNDLIDGIYTQLENNVNTETITKLETKVDDMLQSLALDFVTNEKLDEELAKLETGDKELDLTTYLKVKDAEDKYATKESVTEVDNKVQAIDLTTKADKTELANYTTTADLESKYLTKEQGNSGYVTATIYATEKANLLATQAQVTKKVEAVKTELSTKVTEVEGKVDAIQVPSVDGLASTEYVDNKVKEVQAGTVDKDEVVAALKQDETFKLAVKGDKGDTGETGAAGPSGKDGKSVTVDEVKPVVVEALKQDDDFKNSVKGEAADISTLATKAELAEYLKSTDAENTYTKTTHLEGTYATKQSVTELSTKLDDKADNSELANLAAKSELLEYTKSTELSSTYATVEKVTELEASLSNKADLTKLSDYLTIENAEKTYQKIS